MLSSLAREAAELLWEMVATEDIGDAMQQMRENATTIQVLGRRQWLRDLAGRVAHLRRVALVVPLGWPCHVSQLISRWQYCGCAELYGNLGVQITLQSLMVLT